MSKVYLAGPISGLSFAGATNWRDYAIKELDKSKIIGLSPMRGKDFLKDVARFSSTCEYEGSLHALAMPKGIVIRDRFDATRCDALLVNLLGATAVSIGSVMEIAWADSVRTPIVCAMEKSGNPHEHAMLDQAIGYRVETLDEALHIVRAIFD